MLKFVVSLPGQPDREIVVAGDVATVGRVAPCDVVIDQPYVSKQHLRIFHGTVAVDLGSSNGTFVEGRRLTEAILLEGRTLAISLNGVKLRVDAAPAGEASTDEGDLENLRSRYVLLEAEIVELKRDLGKARDTADQEELIGRLKGENASLRKRLDTLKGELEEREVDDGGSVQAKLAMQRVGSVQELNEKLQEEVERLRAEREARAAATAPADAGARPDAGVGSDGGGEEAAALRAEVERLREGLEREKAAARVHADQTELVRKLRKEIEALRAASGAAAPPPDLERALAQSRDEVKELRARAAELEGKLAEAAPAPQNVSDLFFKLQAENTELRRRVAALDKGGAAAGAPAPKETKHVKELMEARLRITALESELARLKAGGAAPVPATSVPKVPARPVPAERAAAAPACDVRRILQVVVDKDVAGLARPKGGSVEEFVLVESVRLLRQVERVVTRMAGDLIQLFQLQTMLPDTSGCYRAIVSELLVTPDDASRERLGEYLEKLGRWLVASLAAHRKAAVLFAGKLKEDLSEKSLTARDPLPPYARVPMLAGNELWRRSQEYLLHLSPDAIDERIDELARAQAQRILNETP